MRNAIGWVAALVAAAGCGGSGGGETTAAFDEHRGKDVACGACEVAAGGRLQGTVGSGGLVSVTAAPAAGAAPGSGFGGLGVAATGGFEFRSGSTTPGRPPLVGEVDTIVSCTRVSGVLAATLSGAIVSGAAGDIVPGTRFTVVAEDGKGSSADSIRLSVGSFDVPASPVVEGGIEVRHLDRCEATCAEGQCACPADPMVCEPCDGHHGEPAPGDPGHGMDGDVTPGGDGTGTGGDGTGTGGDGTGGHGMNPGTVGDGGGGGTVPDGGGTGGTAPGGGAGGSGPFIPM
jgi:hypothetical protein